MDPTPRYWPNPPVHSSPPRPQPLRFRPDGWVLALAVLTSLGLLVTLALWTYLAYRIVKSRSRLRSVWPGQVLLGGLVLAYALLFTFLPRPTPATCGLLRFGLGFVYAVCFGTLLLKLGITIARHRGIFLPVTVEMLLLALTIGVQVAINSTWLLAKRPTVLVYEDGSTSCNISIGEWVYSLGWVQVLLGIGVIASVAARRIKDNHREPVFIGLAFGFSLPLWIVWILLAVLLRANTPIEEQCIAFGLLANATLILFAMFIPKVRQLSAIGAVGLYREDRPIPKPMTEMTVQKIYYPVYPENGTRQTQCGSLHAPSIWHQRPFCPVHGPFSGASTPPSVLSLSSRRNGSERSGARSRAFTHQSPSRTSSPEGHASTTTTRRGEYDGFVPGIGSRRLGRRTRGRRGGRSARLHSAQPSSPSNTYIRPSQQTYGVLEEVLRTVPFAYNITATDGFSGY